MLAFQPERVRPITCPAFRAGLFESPLDPPGWAGAQPCPIILVGPRASCALKIMSAQDARGPMRMTRHTLSSVRGGASLEQ